MVKRKLELLHTYILYMYIYIYVYLYALYICTCRWILVFFWFFYFRSCLVKNCQRTSKSPSGNHELDMHTLTTLVWVPQWCFQFTTCAFFEATSLLFHHLCSRNTSDGFFGQSYEAVCSLNSGASVTHHCLRLNGVFKWRNLSHLGMNPLASEQHF